MSAKRPPINLMELTSNQATPMAEAEQRRAASVSIVSKPDPKSKAVTPTANLEALAFKVAPAFRKRFRQRAVAADLKLNELLFAALDAWEEKQGLKSKT